MLLGSIAISLLSCENESTKGNSVNDINDTPKSGITDTITEKAIPEPSKPSITYLPFKIKGVDSNYKYITQTFTGDSLNIIKQINRIDKKYFRNADTLIVPEPFSTNILDYSPFPHHLPIIQAVEKMVFFAYPIQAYAVYEKGKLMKWGATSMGKKSSKTPTGLNYTNWKGRKISSSVNSSWILEYNFNVMNKFGVGWHQYEMPGYPASHSCLRLFMDDAIWLYDYMDQWILSSGQLAAKGNPVIIFGDYPWGQRKPWFNLAENPKANDITEADLNALIQPELEQIMQEQENRKQILSQRTQSTSTADTTTTAD